MRCLLLHLLATSTWRGYDDALPAVLGQPPTPRAWIVDLSSSIDSAEADRERQQPLGHSQQHEDQSAGLSSRREETGLDIEPGPLTVVHKNMPRGIVALVFRCKVIGGQLHKNNEAAAFRWADEYDIRQLATDAYAVRLLGGLRNHAPPIVRDHDGTRVL
jgi:8-oxo-dGTP diphosphatase